MSFWDLGYPGAVFVLAGFVKGVIGMGLPAVGVGLLGLVMLPAHAVALMAIPAALTNILQLSQGPGLRVLLRRLWPLLVGIGVGCWIGGGPLSGNQAERARMFLGWLLVLYAVFGLLALRPRVTPRAEPWLAPIAGVLTGIITAATGLSMMPAVPYLNGLGLNRGELVQAIGLAFTVATFALSADLANAGVFDRDVLLGSAAALVPALVGMALGTWLRARIPAETFRRCFFGGMLLTGLQLALR